MKSTVGIMPKRAVVAVGVFLIVALLAGLTFSIVSFISDRDESESATEETATAANPPGNTPQTEIPPQSSPSSNTSPNPTDPSRENPGGPTSPNQPSAPAEPQSSVWVDPQSAGQPWGSNRNGLLTFRGSPTRSWYGTGPIPTQPRIKWVYPASSEDRLCSLSGWAGQEVEWCGTGWTGQPAVFEYNGLTWVVFGAYDGAVHFLNAANGQPIIQPFQTDDLIKGSVTIDPDGYPLVYFGSRDNNLRVVAFDRPEPEELWRLNAYEVSPRYWNDDWDSTPLVINDYLFEGGENSNFHIAKLNRGYDAAERVVVAPTLAYHFPGWDQELLDTLGDTELSIESSVAISGNTLYFANSGGLVQGWDLTGLGTDPDWRPRRVFRFWAGDDVDATITIDAEGMLYVGVERERTGSGYEASAQRTETIGQLLKLDPGQPDDPVVWSVTDLVPLETNPAHLRDDTGLWATPAIYANMVYAATNTGRLLGVDRQTGDICWEKQFGEFLWSSPVVVDGVLLQAASDVDRVSGPQGSYLRAYDVGLDNGCAGAAAARTVGGVAAEPPSGPPQLWAMPLGWRVESTPAVWNGSIYLGDRNGYFYAIG